MNILEEMLEEGGGASTIVETELFEEAHVLGGGHGGYEGFDGWDVVGECIIGDGVCGDCTGGFGGGDSFGGGEGGCGGYCRAKAKGGEGEGCT